MTDHPSGAARILGSWWLLAVVVLAVYLLSPVRDATEHDPAFVPMTAHALVHDRSVAIDSFGAERLVGHPVVLSDGSLDPGFVVERVGGPGWAELVAAVDDPDVEVRDYFPWTSAVMAVPAVVVADVAGAVTGGRDSGELIGDGDFTLWHTATAALVTLGAVLVLRAVALAVLTGSTARRRLLANASALVVALGTSAWSTASRALWQHTPSFLLLSLAVWCAVRIDREGTETGPGTEAENPTGVDRWVIGLGAAVVAAAVARPTNLATGVVLLAWVLYRRRERLGQTALSLAIGVAAAAGAFLLASWALVGRALPDYYSAGRLEVGGWFAEAVLANWWSPSRGLLLASPVLVLAVPGAVLAWRDRERRSLVVALWASVAAVTVSVSAFPQWWAGHAIGPRFMTEAVPQLFVLSLPAADRVFDLPRLRAGVEHRGRAAAAAVVVVLLAAWSIGFHAVGSVAGAAGCWNVFPTDVDDDPGRVWSVVDAQVLEPLHRVLDADRRAAQNAVC